MKKMIMFSFVLLLVMQPISLYAKPKQLTSTITWELKKDGTLIISGTGGVPNLNRDEYPWVKKAKKIFVVEIGEGITSIGNHCFSNEGVKEDKKYKFYRISLPSSLQIIGDKAFYENNLYSVKIPNGVFLICTDAFHSCKISKLYLSPSIKTIGNGAFVGNNITSLKIPEGVSHIGESAFLMCEIDTLSLPSTLETIGEGAFLGNDIFTLKIPEGVTSISENAFFACNITNLSLPSTLKYINDAAFYGNNISVLNIPEGVTTIGEEAFVECNITDVSLPSTLKIIKNAAFNGNHISTLNIPYGVTDIGNDAFRNCGIKVLVLPSTLKKIGDRAFAENNIANVYIPEGVKEIGAKAFAKAFASNPILYVANSVKSIGNWAFGKKMDYSKYDDVYFQGTIQNLPLYVTEDNCTNIGIPKVVYKEYNPTAYDMYVKGYDYYDNDDYQTALQYFLKGTTARDESDNNNRGRCCWYAGICYERLGDLQNALKMYELGDEYECKYCFEYKLDVKAKIAAKEKAALEEKYRKLAQEEFKRGNYEASFKNYQELGKIGRAKTEDWHFIPKSFENKGDYANAIKYYKKVYDILKTNSLVEHIAQLYLKTNNYEEAIEWESILAQAGNKESQYRLGKIYEKAKNKNLAIFWYKKAAEQKHLKAEEALAHYGVYINTQQNTASSQQTTQTSSSQSKTSSSSSQSNTYTPEYGLRDVWVSCWVCHGSGKCPSCNGNGQYVSTRYDGSFNSLDKCQPCYGSGRCYNCNGTGGHYEKQSYQIR